MKIARWKLAASCALLGLCSLTLHAQTDAPQGPPPGGGPHGQWRGGGGGPERQLAMLTKMLTLTPEQQTGVKALLEQQSTQMMALRTKTPSEAAATPATPEARAAERKQMDAIRDETETKISALLNDEQKTTYANWIAKRKAAMAARQAGGPEAPPPAPNN
jgi:protein CpxP